MEKKNGQFTFKSDTEKQAYLKEVIGFFQDERDEVIGVIAAEAFLDFFLEKFGKDVYNVAVRDCQRIVREKMEDTVIDLEMLNDENK
jgi:uncharacterized protein (DUF2164 family)